MGIDDVADKVAGAGVAGLILLAVMSTNGLAGAAAVTAALAMLGPGGMVGGVVLLGLAATISAALTKYGFEQIAIATVRQMRENGKTKTQLKKEIDWYILLSKDLRRKLKSAIDKA